VLLFRELKEKELDYNVVRTLLCRRLVEGIFLLMICKEHSLRPLSSGILAA
jgi:hypothetical protein